MKPFIVVAALLQIFMVVMGHFNDFVLLKLSAVLGVGIPLVVAFLYGRGTGGGKQGATGGLAIGFVGALLGIGLAILLGDQAPALLLFGPLSSAVTGAMGGALGAALIGGPKKVS